jgi:hypothetical protein
MTELQKELSKIFPAIPPGTYQKPVYQMPVYKFVSRKNLDRFFDSGSIRVGTLHDFRKIEAHGKYRGDPAEGKNNIIQHVEFTNRIEEGSFLSKFISPESTGIFENCLFYEQRDFPNSFVFCTSSYFSDELFQLWHENEGVDACYEICNWQAYKREITKKLAPVADAIASSYVTYVTGDIDGESEQRGILPPFIKQREYDWQSEFRGVWLHKAPSIDVKAACIEIPEARKYCRPFAVLEAGKVRRF